VSKRHRLAHSLDNAGAHDLVGGLGHLTRAAGAHVGHRFAHFFQDRLRTIEYGFIAAAHDGERRRPRAFDTAAHGAVEKSDTARVELVVQVALRVFPHRRTIHDYHVW